MALDSIFNKTAQTRLLDVPAGKAFLYPVSYGLNAALVQKLASMGVPPVAAGFLIALAYRRLDAVKKFLGDAGSEMLAVGAFASGLDNQVSITPRVWDFIAGKLGVSGSLMRINGGGAAFSGSRQPLALPAVTPAKLGAPRTGSPQAKLITARTSSPQPMGAVSRKVAAISVR